MAATLDDGEPRFRHPFVELSNAAISIERVIVKSGVWPVESSGDLTDLFYLDPIFEFNSRNDLRQVIKSS